MEVWSLSGYLGEEDVVAVGEVDAVVVEEEVTMVILTMKLNKMEEIMDTMVVLHSIMGMMMEVWSLSGHMVEEEGAGEEVDEVVVEEEVSMVLHLTMKLNKTEETMVLLHMIMSTMGEAWSLSGHLVEEEGAGEEVYAVDVEEEVTMVLHHTMKLNKMEETTDTMVLNRIMDTMVNLRAVEDVEGEVVEEEEEAVVDSTDQMDHRFRQLLK